MTPSDFNSADRNYYDVVVIGSGPAGLSAALAAAENSVSVLLCERLHSFGLKLLASGGAKCNVSNILDESAFINAFGRDGRFMKPALDFSYHEWLFSFLKAQGVPLKLENNFHYFPVSERSRDILSAFTSAFQRLGGTMRNETLISEIIVNDGVISGVKTNDGFMTACRSVVLAAGGTAWPKLGGTKSGLLLAQALGHTVTPLYPAMAPLLIRDSWIGELSGISLPDAELCFRRGRLIFRNRGELLFTHDGLSGPCALDLAGDLAETCDKNGSDTEILFKPDASMNESLWRTELDSWRRSEGRKQIRTLLSWRFPRALADRLCGLSDCSEEKVCELSAAQRDALVLNLCACRLSGRGSGPMEKAMAMKGGIKLKEIEPSTLESRLIDGLFFAGEILELAGPCGGYNIQWALSSGRLAGKSSRFKVESSRLKT